MCTFIGPYYIVQIWDVCMFAHTCVLQSGWRHAVSTAGLWATRSKKRCNFCVCAHTRSKIIATERPVRKACVRIRTGTYVYTHTYTCYSYGCGQAENSDEQKLISGTYSGKKGNHRPLKWLLWEDGKWGSVLPIKKLHKFLKPPPNSKKKISIGG